LSVVFGAGLATKGCFHLPFSSAPDPKPDLGALKNLKVHFSNR